MKKIYLIVLAAALTVLPVQTAMSKDFFSWGVKAGLNFTNMSGLNDFAKEDFLKTYTGFNVGAAFNLNLPLGFEIQPELLYSQSGSKIAAEQTLGGITFSGTETLRSGSLRIPVNVIWGWDLFGVVKPYVFLSPYIGFGLFANDTFVGKLGTDATTTKKTNLNDQLNVMQYGVGVGAGLKVWKIQVSFKWNWDLNPAFKVNKGESLGTVIGDASKDMKFNGGELSLAILF